MERAAAQIYVYTYRFLSSWGEIGDGMGDVKLPLYQSASLMITADRMKDFPNFRRWSGRFMWKVKISQFEQLEDVSK